jgi:hypothetical protein
MGQDNELVKTVKIGKTKVDVYGCWDNDTPENKFDFYDLYVDGECINEGEPCYKKPTREDIEAFLELRELI